jgi:PAS domain S-box-containing protein
MLENEGLNWFDSLPYAAIVLNPDGSISNVNPAFTRFTGITAGEVRGQMPPFSFWPQDKSSQYYQECLAAQKSRMEWLLKKKSGETGWVEACGLSLW